MIVCIIIAFPLKAQISEGGLPPSFNYTNTVEKSTVPCYLAPINFDVMELLAEDDEMEELGMRPRCAKIIPTSISMENYGTWITLPDGTLIWQMKIHAPEALSIMLYYDKFIIPKGGKLFIYNPERTKILGAYTEKTNTYGKEFATEFVYGDKIILEYVAPEPENENAFDLPQIEISGIAYGYNHIFIYTEDDGLQKVRWDSQSCMINVNCPEGDNWQDQKKGVARILTPSLDGGTYLCSGSLINNTAQDFDPLFISAYHCYMDMTETQMNQAVYYFHYEYQGCTNLGTDPNCPTIVGAQYLVDIHIKDGSDGALVRLNSAIPEDYGVYFNGWDRRNVAPESGVGIHHPGGDVKKISTYNGGVFSDYWFGSGYRGANDAHWNLAFISTETGHSVTEGGSSGSPLFNQNGLIVGTLTGGSSNCYNNKSGDNLYGKLWYHWDQHTSKKMKPYLDPANTDKEELDGAYMGQGMNPVANFTYEPREVVNNYPVRFTSTSKNASSYDWTFQGADIDVSTDMNPLVTFVETGSKEVSLTINKGTDKERTKTVLINVGEAKYPKAAFLMNGTDKDTVYIGYKEIVSFSNLSEGSYATYSWTFEGGNPASSIARNPNVTYTEVGTYTVSLKVENFLGEDTIEKIVVSDYKLPEADFKVSSEYFNKYPDYGAFIPVKGGKVMFEDMSLNSPDNRTWEFVGAFPVYSDLEQPEVEYVQGRKNYTVKLTVDNPAGEGEVEKKDFVQVGGVAPVWNIPFGEQGDSFFTNINGAYITGTNTNYSIIAERFENSSKGSVRKVDILLQAMKGDVTQKVFTISISKDNNGLPGTTLKTKTLAGRNVNKDGYTTVDFGEDIAIDGSFFILVSGLSNSDNKVAIGASESQKETVYVRPQIAWIKLSELYPFHILSLNIMPHFTYEGPVDIEEPEEPGSSINELNKPFFIKLLPNPVVDIMRLESNEPILNVWIMDMQGRIMSRYTDENVYELNVDMTNHPKGMYMVKMQTKTSMLNSKIIKK